MKVREIMTDTVIYVKIPGSRADAIKTILKENISCLPVVKRGTNELLGIVTREDFARNPEEEQLALLMTRDVRTISPEADIREAVEIFSRGEFRRLPVIENSELVGLITVSDIVWRYISKLGLTDPVEKYMASRITSMWEKNPLKVTYEIMNLSGERALPVLNDEGKFTGIIGDTDLLKVLEVSESTVKSELSGGTEGDKWGWDTKNIIYITKKRLEFPDRVVKDIMVDKVVIVRKKTAISEAAKRMAKNRIEQIPVINAEGDLIGIVRDSDLIKAVL